MQIASFCKSEFNPFAINNTDQNVNDILKTSVSFFMPLTRKGINLIQNADRVEISNEDMFIRIIIHEVAITDLNNKVAQLLSSDGSDKAVFAKVECFENGFPIEGARTDMFGISYDTKQCRRSYNVYNKVNEYVYSFNNYIYDLLAEKDPMVNLVAKSIPCTIKSCVKTACSLKAIVDINGHDVIITYKQGYLNATISHKYTECEKVYGNRYSDYSISHKVNSKKELKTLNWNAMFHDLYEHRNGKLISSGSLGS